MTRIEELCRLICKSKGIDPDRRGYGLGHSMPKGSEYALWEAQVTTAEYILDWLAGRNSAEEKDSPV